MPSFPEGTSGIAPEQGAIRIRRDLSIPRSELTLRATRAGGPGGQHVNTSSTRVELIWNVFESAALTDEQRERLSEKLGTRLDAEGNLRIVSSETRSQLRNRRRAEEKLVEVLAAALTVARKRRQTKPGRAAREKRLHEKKIRSEKKSRRRINSDD